MPLAILQKPTWSCCASGTPIFSSAASRCPEDCWGNLTAGIVCPFTGTRLWSPAGPSQIQPAVPGFVRFVVGVIIVIRLVDRSQAADMSAACSGRPRGLRSSGNLDRSLLLGWGRSFPDRVLIPICRHSHLIERKRNGWRILHQGVHATTPVARKCSNCWASVQKPTEDQQCCEAGDAPGRCRGCQTRPPRQQRG